MRLTQQEIKAGTYSVKDAKESLENINSAIRDIESKSIEVLPEYWTRHKKILEDYIQRKDENA